jgi:hypothetical protein
MAGTEIESSSTSCSTVVLELNKNEQQGEAERKQEKYCGTFTNLADGRERRERKPSKRRSGVGWFFAPLIILPVLETNRSGWRAS